MKYVFLLFVMFFAGCSGGDFPLAAVSGTVTYNGKPIEGAEVVFAPIAVDDTARVGPASTGITDAQGKYTLTTVREKRDGAVVTDHYVSIGFREVDESLVAVKVEEVNKKNPNMTRQQLAALEQEVKDSMGSNKSLPETYNTKSKLTFKVEGPTENADFDLKEDGS